MSPTSRRLFLSYMKENKGLGLQLHKAYGAGKYQVNRWIIEVALRRAGIAAVRPNTGVRISVHPPLSHMTFTPLTSISPTNSLLKHSTRGQTETRAAV